MQKANGMSPAARTLKAVFPVWRKRPGYECMEGVIRAEILKQSIAESALKWTITDGKFCLETLIRTFFGHLFVDSLVVSFLPDVLIPEYSK